MEDFISAQTIHNTNTDKFIKAQTQFDAATITVLEQVKADQAKRDKLF